MLQYLVSIRFSSISTAKTWKAECQSNNSLFMLVGNPGIVWHPVTGQFVKTKLQTKAVSGVKPNGKKIRD
jgi:hypothetical protein